jgi:1,4-dihydroxy-2-naphthoate octaprenyltransferase
VQAALVHHPSRADRRQNRLAGSGRKSTVEWKRGVAVVPDPTQRVDERRASGEVDRNEVRHAQKATVTFVNRWIIGARPRTLPAAVVPVAIGAGAAVGGPSPVWWRVVPALVVSLALQIGVNYSNDYSDGIRGTDDVRVGPTRLVAGGLATPASVKRAAFAAFGVAAVAGLVLAIATSWWLIVVGLAAMLAAWGYTGGPKPYGYLGLGELFVFVFFGLVATVGTTFAVIEGFPAHAWVAGCTAGFLACALLVVNNLRDIPTDRASGKRTLAVRLGDGGRGGCTSGAWPRPRFDHRGCRWCGGRGPRFALVGFVAAVPPVQACASWRNGPRTHSCSRRDRPHPVDRGLADGGGVGARSDQ